MPLPREIDALGPRPGHEIYLCVPEPEPDPVLGGLADAELAMVRDPW